MEPAVADKPEFVDMISEATRQNRRRTMPRVIEPEVKETSRLGHRPARLPAMADRNPDAVEDQGMGHQGLGLS
jgi:hypothetical protein